jgi:outer membrane protein
MGIDEMMWHLVKGREHSVFLSGLFPRLLFYISLVIAGITSASIADAQSLKEALTAAYLNNPALLGQRAGLRAADEKVPQALSNWRPSISFTGSAGGSAVMTSTTDGVNRHQHREPKSIAVTVTQQLFRGGRTIAATSSAENSVQAERARLLEKEQDILLLAAKAFLNVHKDEAVLNLKTSNEEVLKRQMQATRDRYQVGEITRTDVYQASARMAGASADLIASKGTLESSRAAYKNVIGNLTPHNLVLPEIISVLPNDLDEAVQMALKNNPSVIASEYDRKALDDNVDSVRGELLPSLNLTTGLSKKFQSGSETGRIDTADVTLNLTVPLFQQGTVYSKMREAKQKVAKAIHTVDQARRDAIEAATKAWESLLSARAQVKSFKAQNDANKVALEGVQREAQVGSRTVLDVLDAEQELLDSRVSSVTSERDRLLAVFELKVAIGQLTAKDLELEVEAYSAVENYQQVRGKWFGASITDGGP